MINSSFLELCQYVLGNWMIGQFCGSSCRDRLLQESNETNHGFGVMLHCRSHVNGELSIKLH